MTPSDIYGHFKSMRDRPIGLIRHLIPFKSRLNDA